MEAIALIAGARTPIGKFNGTLRSRTAMDLGGIAISAALRRAEVAPTDVDHVLMGHVLQAGQGQITARQAADKADIPMSTPATTINKVCLSGLSTIYMGALMLAAGDADVVVAGGMESMSNAPFLLPGGRAGLKMGHAAAIDSMIHDGLWCAFEDRHMGSDTDHYAAKAAISREAQDEIAFSSHRRAGEAQVNGLLSAEIVAVGIPGEDDFLDVDEGVRAATSIERLAKLRPAFEPNGTVTAGNASQLSDGASAIVMMRQNTATKRGLRNDIRVAGYGQVAGPENTSLLHQPARALLRALAAAEHEVGDLDVLEINEAFAAVSLASSEELGIDPMLPNKCGGAIAMGHPLGCSGSRLALTVMQQLRATGGTVGAAALCGGGGQGDALVLTHSD